MPEASSSSLPVSPAVPQLHPDCVGWLTRPVLVGLSGGRDSVALLHLLRGHGCRLFACHVHHGIRGGEADADAAFCQELCDSLGIPLRPVILDVPALAKRWGESLELAARNARRAALVDECHRVGAVGIALAHHADDQAETALFRLARGAAGPRAMHAVTHAWGAMWLRPLLNCRRAELTSWLQAHGIEWRDDSTNEDAAACTRNALRHEVLPALSRALGRDVVPILNRSARVQEEADSALREALALLPLTDPQGRLFLPALEGRSHAFTRAVLYRYVMMAGVPGVDDSMLRRIEAILPADYPCSRLSLPGGWQACRRHRRLELLENNELHPVEWNPRGE